MTERARKVDFWRTTPDEEWKWLVDHFGMHMAFDPEHSARLNDRTFEVGWKLAEEDLPDDYGRMDDDADALDRASTRADEYRYQLLEQLALNWVREG